mmetsp:Transcript_5060/g.7585  ORF Transcript_5060/g.7585 Transcript_5060/m.7585 type:complete len:196 (-) Transcript_5060:16-603(-)
MCIPGPNGVLTIEAEKEPNEWSKRMKVGFIVLIFFYFFPWTVHRVRSQPSVNWKLASPPSVMRLEILESRIETVRLKRDGGLKLISSLNMLIHNDLFIPLKVRGLNMTAALPMLGINGLYQAGYQHISPFTAPPRGSATMNATYVFTDLRFPMLLKMVTDILQNSIGHIFFSSSTDYNLLESRSFGYVDLWCVFL